MRGGSVEAWSVQTAGRTRLVQEAVLTALEEGPATDDELYDRYRAFVRTGDAPAASPTSVRIRRGELVRAGSVAPLDIKGTSAYGRPATRWVRRDLIDQTAQLWHDDGRLS